jgi:phenylalanyl-tRNA synthetase beta chain
MPTILIKKKDLEELLSHSISLPDLDARLPLVKGELKGYDEATGEMKIELNDTNRPDLWCVEGIARQFRIHRDRKAGSYSFYHGKRKPKAAIEVDPSMAAVRPFIGACIARGLSIDNESLVQLIQTQEKLSESFGRRRQLVSIGLYRMEKIRFPVKYRTTDPGAVQFIPLGFDNPMTPGEILEKHPKGIAYGGLLSKAPAVPLLVDREDRVLSFPPIINSREIGEVQVGDTDLFVEVTGTDFRMVALTVNILAANLADRGAAIDPVEVRYPYETDGGKNVSLPAVLGKPLHIGLSEFRVRLGETVDRPQAVRVLKEYGYQIESKKNGLSVSVPPYRDDLLHPVDVVEDFAISRGYETFQPEMPSEFTVGGFSPEEAFTDRVREAMIGMGFQEVISNILTDHRESLDRMNLAGTDASGGIVSVENVMSQSYSALRNAVVPSLLRVEAASSKSFYPHLIFETGETAVTDPKSPEGTLTVLKLAALLAHPGANFSQLHSYLDHLMYYLGRDYRLEPVPHPSYIEGRVGRVTQDGVELGIIGELHPQVLENWQIAMPSAVFELNLDALLKGQARGG